MFKRILAWILLILFILLIVNIYIFRFYPLESGILYIFIVLLFLFGRKRIIEYNPPQFEEEEDE